MLADRGGGEAGGLVRHVGGREALAASVREDGLAGDALADIGIAEGAGPLGAIAAAGDGLAPDDGADGRGELRPAVAAAPPIDVFSVAVLRRRAQHQQATVALAGVVLEVVGVACHFSSSFLALNTNAILLIS